MEIIKIASEKEINQAARKFIRLMNNHRVFAFYGEMGSGKTTFIKAVCRELGVIDNVSSPTFALVNEYVSASAGIIYHLDLYRIKSIEELFDFGYEDYFYGGELCFIEWPGKAEQLLPSDAERVQILVEPNGGRILKVGV